MIAIDDNNVNVLTNFGFFQVKILVCGNFLPFKVKISQKFGISRSKFWFMVIFLVLKVKIGQHFGGKVKTLVF